MTHSIPKLSFITLLIMYLASTGTLAESAQLAQKRALMHQNLVVDHINFSFDPATYEKVQQLASLFENTNFDTVKTQQLEYDVGGIMLRDGSYVEFLNRTKSIAATGFQMAVVWCALDPDLIDVDQLPQLYPEAEWTGRDATLLDGTQWYTTYQIAPRPAPYTTWGMYYHDRSRYRVYDYRQNPPEEAFTFQEWVAARARIPEALVEDILRMSVWFPNPVQRLGDQVHMVIPTPGGNDFDLYLTIDPSVTHATLDSLSLRMIAPKQPADADGIEFSLDKDVLTMKLAAGR